MTAGQHIGSTLSLQQENRASMAGTSLLQFTSLTSNAGDHEDCQPQCSNFLGAHPPLGTKFKSNSPTTVWERTAEMSQPHTHNHCTLSRSHDQHLWREQRVFAEPGSPRVWSSLFDSQYKRKLMRISWPAI